MVRLTLCDDDERYVELLESRVRDYCQRNEKKVCIAAYTDSSKLEDEIIKGNLSDAYILDIEMPDYSGMELVERIREQSELPQVILLTAYESFAVEACGRDVLWYVLKEGGGQELFRALDKLFVRLKRQLDEKTYVISNQQRYKKLFQKDILYIQKEEKNAVFILTDGKKEKERLSLQKIYPKLDNPDMMFLDRGIIINLNHIREFGLKEIVMDDGYVIGTRKACISELRKRMNHYL